MTLISMIISSEIENVEKVENLRISVGKSGKSILRAFARTRAKNRLKYFFVFLKSTWSTWTLNFELGER